MITKDDLIRAGVGEAVAARLIESMPEKDGASDYAAFLGKAFSP